MPLSTGTQLCITSQCLASNNMYITALRLVFYSITSLQFIPYTCSVACLINYTACYDVYLLML